MTIQINPFPCNPQDLAETLSKLGDGSIVKRFRLTNTLALMGSATAVIRNWGGSSWSNGAAITVNDEEPSPGAWKGVANYEGWCTPRGTSTTDYSIIWMDTIARYIRGALTESLCDGSASATVTHYARGQNPGTPITVYDPQGFFGNGENTCKYAAVYSDVAARYEVVECEQVATLIRCTAASAFCPDDARVSVNSPATNLSPYPYNITVSPGSVKNNGQAGGIGDELYCLRITNHSDCSYDWIIVNAPASTQMAVIVGVRIVGNLVQVQYRDVYTNSCGDTYDWQTIHVGTYCD